MTPWTFLAPILPPAVLLVLCLVGVALIRLRHIGGGR